MKLLILFVVLIAHTNRAHAFPEMIRHGYTSCVACHVSPAGGGLLTTYGRSISSELLSRWSYKGEEELLHGALAEKVRTYIDGSRERGLNVGGDFRFLQTRVETKTFKQGRFIPMQRDLEGAIRYDDLSLVASYGVVYHPRATDAVELRRAYALYNVAEGISLRAGKFIPIFGIMLSDHYLGIKQGLRLGLGSERETVEAGFIFEKLSGQFSFSETSDTANLRDEKSATAGVNLHLGETHRIGVNYWLGSYNGGRRDITGFHALLGFSKKLYSLSEVDLQVEVPNSQDRVKSIRYFQRLGFEVTRGLHLLAQLDGSQSDLARSSTKFNSPGLGLNFYPRPHWEVQALWSRPKFEGQPASDSAFFLLHYYL